MTAKKYIFQTVTLGAIFVALIPALANATMSGSQYSIYADSVSVGGVDVQSSANYSLQGSIGEFVAGTSTGASYVVTAGYQSMEREGIALSLSSNSLNFGSLTDSDVTQVSVVAGVTSMAASGYTLSIDSVTGNIPATVNDGSVTAGQNEYGFKVSGTDAAFVGDKAVAPGQVVATANSDRSASDTTITFRASRNGNAVVGSYSQTITFLLSVNF